MHRSKLLDSVERMAKDHEIARRHNVSVQTVREWRAEAAERRRGLGRRGFLVGAGAAAATLMLPRVSKAAPQPTIAIVGGGIAGLSCALQLADAGLTSTVYEASTRLGGRMHSNVGYFNDGQVSEWCGELIDSGHKTVQTLAKRFNLNLVDLVAAQPNGSQDTYYFFNQYYPQAQADSDFQALHHALQSDVQSAPFPTTYNSSTPAGRALDNISVYDWIEQNVPGGHGSPMGQLLDAAYNEEYGADTNVQSSLNLIYLLGFQASPGNFAIFGASDERYHIAGGNQQLPTAIANYLGALVKTGYALTSIAEGSDGRFTLSFDVGKTTTTVVTDYVVLCIPFPILRGLDYSQAGFDPKKVDAITNLGDGRNGKLQLQFSDRLWNGTGPWPGVSNGNSYSDTGVQNTWDVTRAQTGRSGILVDYSGGSVTLGMSTTVAYATAGAKGVNTDAQRYLGQIERYFPGLTARWNGKVASSLPHLDPFLKLSYSYWKVGQYQRIAGYEGVRQGNCLFAGEHTSIDFQGYMEGGASTGQAAANTIIADLK
jgi:monoamine oxidase